MSVPRVSILTPSTRPEGLLMVANCLMKQTITDFEWLISLPQELTGKIQINDPRVRIIADPSMRPGDFYRLNGSWNSLLKKAKASLLVFTVDWIHFKPDMIERMLGSHLQNPTVCITVRGDHYLEVVHGKPSMLWKQDPRLQFVPNDGVIGPHFFEMSLASIPAAKLREVGGFDEQYDTGAGMSEKECARRLEKAGCTFFLSEDPRHLIWKHPKVTSQNAWDQAYQRAYKMYEQHVLEIEAWTRRTVPDLNVATEAKTLRERSRQIGERMPAGVGTYIPTDSPGEPIHKPADLRAIGVSEEIVRMVEEFQNDPNRKLNQYVTVKPETGGQTTALENFVTNCFFCGHRKSTKSYRRPTGGTPGLLLCDVCGPLWESGVNDHPEFVRK